MGNLVSRITDCQRQMKSMFDVFNGTTPRILILGLDGAGKTTLMYSAKLDDFIYAIAPPTGVIIEHVTPRRGARMQLFDLPGSKLSRHLWHSWFPKTEGIIYVVDSADKVRVDEAKFELHDLLTSRWLSKVPLIVVANKQDLPESMTEDEVVKELDLEAISNRDWSIFGVSAKKGKDVMNIFVDAIEKIKAYRHYKSSLTEKVTDKKHTNEKDSKKVNNNNINPAFTSIEDIDAMEETVPSLFANINNKTAEAKSDTDAQPNDSGVSSRESVTYDHIDDIKDETDNENSKLSDSMTENDFEPSVNDRSDDSGHEEEVINVQREKTNESVDSDESGDISVEVKSHFETNKNISSDAESDNVDKSDVSVKIVTNEFEIKPNSKPYSSEKEVMPDTDKRDRDFENDKNNIPGSDVESRSSTISSMSDDEVKNATKELVVEESENNLSDNAATKFQQGKVLADSKQNHDGKDEETGQISNDTSISGEAISVTNDIDRRRRSDNEMVTDLDSVSDDDLV